MFYTNTHQAIRAKMLNNDNSPPLINNSVTKLVGCVLVVSICVVVDALAVVDVLAVVAFEIICVVVMGPVKKVTCVWEAD